MPGSTTAFSLAMIRPGDLGLDFWISRSIKRSIVSRVVTGDTINLRNIEARVLSVKTLALLQELNPVRILNKAETSAPKSAIAGQEANVGVLSGGGYIIISGGDMNIAP